MTIIEIASLENGAHRNQTGDFATVPEGWAVIPDGMEIENFPFGDVTAEEIDGIMTAASWTPGTTPEPEPEPEPEPTVDERVATLETENNLLKQQLTALSDQNDFHEELIVELANIVYS